MDDECRDYAKIKQLQGGSANLGALTNCLGLLPTNSRKSLQSLDGKSVEMEGWWMLKEVG